MGDKGEERAEAAHRFAVTFDNFVFSAIESEPKRLLSAVQRYNAAIAKELEDPIAYTHWTPTTTTNTGGARVTALHVDLPLTLPRNTFLSVAKTLHRTGQFTGPEVRLLAVSGCCSTDLLQYLVTSCPNVQRVDLSQCIGLTHHALGIVLQLRRLRDLALCLWQSEQNASFHWPTLVREFAAPNPPPLQCLRLFNADCLKPDAFVPLFECLALLSRLDVHHAIREGGPRRTSLVNYLPGNWGHCEAPLWYRRYSAPRGSELGRFVDNTFGVTLHARDRPPYAPPREFAEQQEVVVPLL